MLYLTAEYLSLKHQDKDILTSVSAIPIYEQTENEYQIYSNGFRTEKTGICL